MSRLTRDKTTAEPVSRAQILRRERGQGDINFPCSADHDVQNYWQQLYTVDPYSSYNMFDHTYIHTYIHFTADGPQRARLPIPPIN